MACVRQKFGFRPVGELSLLLPRTAARCGAEADAEAATAHSPAVATTQLSPRAPNLRRSVLDRDLMLETIACGRPGTEMPFNLEGAYTEIECYGIPVGEVPPETFGAGGLTAEELETLVDFLFEYVVGVTRVTRQNCAAFFEGNANARACIFL